MKLFTACKLTHTLQTYLGMVINDGEPQPCSYPCMPNYLIDKEKFQLADRPVPISEEALVSLFTSCILERRLPRFRNAHNGLDVERLNANIYGCCDINIDTAFMKRNIDSLMRLDLEQAAAVVISAIRNDDAIADRPEIVRSLLKEIQPKVLSHSCMWFKNLRTGSANAIQGDKFSGKFSNLATEVRHVIGNKHMIEVGKIHDWSPLVQLLLRIRRCSPQSRCLFIPEWIFQEANTAPPSEYCVWDSRGRVEKGHEPSLPPTSESIMLTRKEFRRLQRRLLRYSRFWDPTVILRQEIKNLEANVIYSAELIRSQVLPSNDTLVVAHYFLALQRRLQRKVVSDLHWTAFLAKGESGTIMQNNPGVPTTFEEQLGAFSGQNGVPLTGAVLPQIDQCCLLMESYVKTYGKGDRGNLVFVRGVRGGSGRGAVDDYNLLCDVLSTLCGKAKEEGLEMPGPVRKFLAKDIMASNGAFDDDAFAGGRVPGWETWLAERRGKGILHGMEALSLE